MGFSFRKAGFERADDRDAISKMIGEFFRELGVLLIVFYPIESHLRDSAWGKLVIFAVGIGCVSVGIIIERRR